MGDVARPMLAEVLAVLTELPADVWAPALGERSPGWCVRPVLDAIPGVRFDLEVPGATVGAGPRASWLHTSPAEAQETLVARGVLPEGWCGDVRRGWWCPVCSGRGVVTYQTEGGLEDDGCGVCAVDDPDATGGVRLTGYTPHAATIPDLVAVASLGWTAIDCAEELAREACRTLREYGCPQPERVVWRVAPKFHRYDTVWSRDVRRGETMVLVRDGRLDVPLGFGQIKRHIILPVEALWEMGLALDAITDAVRIVAPPVGGGR